MIFDESVEEPIKDPLMKFASSYRDYDNYDL